MYKYSLCVPAIPLLAHNLANIIKAMFGKNKKAIAIDLDNTLWGGVVGDDGVEGIEIGHETSMGQVYGEFQSYIHMHRDLGVVLNIFPDSIVFIDDNPVERGIVAAQVAGVVVPEMDRAEHYIEILDRSGFFEVVKISDKYGDNGLVSVLIGKIEDNVLHLDLLLMSCRVLKRNMEHALLDMLVKESAKAGITKIIGYYYKTAKNEMVRDFYWRMGFTKIKENGEDTIWELNTEAYREQNKVIKINSGG